MSQPLSKLLLLISVLLVYNLPAYAKAVMRAGAWQTFITIILRPLGKGEKEHVTMDSSKICMTQSYVDKRPYLTPGIDAEQMLRHNAKCTMSNEKVTENTASWEVKCEMQGATITTNITNHVDVDEFRNLATQLILRGTTYAALSEIHTSGRYIGECTEDMKTLQ